MMKQNKDNIFTLRISSNLKKELQEKAASTGKSASAIVTDLLMNLFNKAA